MLVVGLFVGVWCWLIIVVLDYFLVLIVFWFALRLLFLFGFVGVALIVWLVIGSYGCG